MARSPERPRGDGALTDVATGGGSLFHALLDSVRATVSGERALESVRTLARHHRVQASPGYDEAAEWLAGRLATLGLAVERETVPGDGRTRRLGSLMPQGWACSRAIARLVDGTARECLCDYDAEKLSLILRSAPARGRFPIVVRDEGAADADADLRGAVVLTRSPAHAAHRRWVVEGGAAGLLYDGRRLVPPVRDLFDDPDALSYTSFWWNETEPRGWGFVLSPRAGARLRERLHAGAPLELEVEIESRAFDTKIPLVSATIPAIGGGAPAGEILVVSHLCHPQPSANDNASGVAANLEAARVLSALAARGAWSPAARGVRFLWVPELTGTCAWLAGAGGRVTSIAAALNLDMVGEDQEQCGSTFLIERPPSFGGSFAEELLLRIRREATDWVPSYSGPGHFSMARAAEVPFAAGSDHAVLVAGGVPCPMMIQWPDRFYHSSHDTPDKCDPRSLAQAATCAATYAGFLASAGAREVEWLTEAVGRGARRRALDALDEPDASRAFARERLRGQRAFASLRRLGAGAAPVAEAARAFEEFARREGACVPECALPKHSRGTRPARPRRAEDGYLEFLWHLLPGFERLPAEARAAWSRMEHSVPGGRTTLELAWLACDGSRTLEEIAHMVWLESGAAVQPRGSATAPGLAELFERLAETGLVSLGADVVA
jgi:hypothetical protein